jgi:hypothetical protein
MFIPRRKNGVSVTRMSVQVDLDDRITNCMTKSRSWDAVSGSAFWQITEGSCPRSQEPTTGSYNNPTLYFSTIRFNITLMLMPSSPQWSLTSTCSDWNFVYISLIPIRVTCPWLDNSLEGQVTSTNYEYSLYSLRCFLHPSIFLSVVDIKVNIHLSPDSSCTSIRE